MSHTPRRSDAPALGRRRFLGTIGAAGAMAALGAPAIGRAQAREVKVGYILPVTGPLAFEAQLALNGLQLAVDEINGGGGIKSLGGAKIVLLPGDTQNKVELGNSEAARLIDQNVTALIGPFSSLVAFSVRQVTEKNKTPFLLLATVADNVLEGGLHYAFRMQPNARAMATLTLGNMIEMSKNAGLVVKRVAIMHEDGNFGTTMGNHVEAFAAKMGYEVVQRVPYNLRSPDFTAELSKKVNDAAVALDPGDRESRALLSLLRADAGGGEAAGVARLLADDTFVTVAFGTVCLEQGLADEAAVVFTRMLRRDPGNTEARERLEMALRARSRRKG